MGVRTLFLSPSPNPSRQGRGIPDHADHPRAAARCIMVEARKVIVALLYVIVNHMLDLSNQTAPNTPESRRAREIVSATMTIDPLLVNEERRKALPCLPISLMDKFFKERLTDP